MYLVIKSLISGKHENQSQLDESNEKLEHEDVRTGLVKTSLGIKDLSYSLMTLVAGKQEAIRV